ncbi:MAG TPA: response regulator transcription factor [Nocardioidaceae bacterium]|nr:response regulator transcription factor [Nocardioidaceae bacterium]
MSTTVLLVDDHQLIREGLCRAFDRSADFEVVGEAGSVKQATTLIDQVQPQVVVTDVRLPDGTGLELATRLRARDEQVGIVVLTMHAGDDTLFAALESGASAFVSKDAPSPDVVAAARHAAASPRSFTAKDLAGAMQRRMTPAGPQLSAREREILLLLADGLGVTPIARQLFISESTAKAHISKIYEKLGAANRAQAIMRAVQAGLISAGSSALT